MASKLKLPLISLFTILGLVLLFHLSWQAGTPLTQGAESEPPGGEYIGSEMCMTCHQDLEEDYQHTVHFRIAQNPRNELEGLGCESCHGPGSRHLEDQKNPYGLVNFGKKSKTSLALQNQACLQCHQKSHSGWLGSIHEQKSLACAECHQVMEKVSDKFLLAKSNQSDLCGSCHRSQKAKTLKSYHMAIRDGKLECSSCHNPHGTPNDRQLLAHSVNETCFQCHADKRGPYLWQHPPVLENCSNCHDPHGTSHAKMLVTQETRLCQSCHVATRHPTQPQDPAALFVFNRSCTNCHSQIHGSNHPSGVRFTR
jgi:DmsE family decaheme c-type cytochrome